MTETNHRQCYVGGRWVAASGADPLPVIDPCTEAQVGAVTSCTPDDVDRAVTAAHAALEDWSARPVEERAAYVQAIADGMQSRRQEFTNTVCLELGAPSKPADMIQVGLPIFELGLVAGEAASFPFEESVGTSRVLRQPIGVVGAITPWNFPLHQITAKLAPALTAGCTMVLKPSEITPLSALNLAQVIDEVGLPPGVFNLVTGTGPIIGEAIARHPGIDMVSFTGSTRAGRRVSELAAATVKRVALELGGKSANLILDGADIEKAVTIGIRGAFANSGQACSALTRMLVPATRLKEIEDLAAEVAAGYRLGTPYDPDVKLGPLVSRVQRERVLGYIKAGQESGARKVCGGTERPDHLERGFFVQPTIFSDVDPSATIAQEEIFGPVLSIIPFGSEQEAVEIANNSRYGLAAAVWAEDQDRAVSVARRLQVGQVEINGGRFNGAAPFGGWKQSGNGREGGKFGLAEYLELTALQL